MESHFVARTYHGDPTWVDAALEDANVWLMVLLITHLDPFMSRQERIGTRDTFRRALDTIASDQLYRGLPRSSKLVIQVLGEGRLDPQHWYSYCPRPLPGEMLGALVFLHGHGTNYLAVIQALRPLADRLRVVLIAPTFGYGNWEALRGVEASERAIAFGLKEYPVDPACVFLAGLSQGGAGVSRAAAAHPYRYAGLIFISATMELRVLESEEFVSGWKGKPVLVIQGNRDYNVSPGSVMSAVESMLTNGVKVTLIQEPNSGHFLFFAKLKEMENVIANWAERVVQERDEAIHPGVPAGD